MRNALAIRWTVFFQLNYLNTANRFIYQTQHIVCAVTNTTEQCNIPPVLELLCTADACTLVRGVYSLSSFESFHQAEYNKTILLNVNVCVRLGLACILRHRRRRHCYCPTTCCDVMALGKKQWTFRCHL